MKLKRITYPFLILALSLSLANCGKGGGETEGSGVEPVPPKVKVISVGTRVSVQNKIKVSGRIEPNVEALLSSDIDAKVVVVHVGINEHVKKGELLIELKSAGDLGGLLPHHIISPIDGRVVELFMERGELIKEGDELIRVKNMSSVRVVLYLPAMYYDDIQVGQGVRISVPGLPGLRFIGLIYLIAREIDEENATFEVQVMVRNPQGKLKAGLKANASIDTGIAKDVHVIPASALTTVEGKDVVYIVVNDRAVEKEVVLVRRTDEIIQVLEGLTISDQVVVSFDKEVTNGAKVIVD